MSGVLGKNLAKYRIVEGHRPQDEGSPLRFKDRLSAVSFLRGFLGDPFSVSSLRTHLLTRGFVTDVSPMDDHEVVEEFARHLVSGRIGVVRVDRHARPVRWVIPPGEDVQPERGAAEERPRRRATVFPEPSGGDETGAREDTRAGDRAGAGEEAEAGVGTLAGEEMPAAGEGLDWVTFQVVDDETGQPLEGILLKLKLPSGGTGNPATGPDGTIEINDLMPGTLDILEITNGGAVEVVGID